MNEKDKKLINHLVENPLDDHFTMEQIEQDPMEIVENHYKTNTTKPINKNNSGENKLSSSLSTSPTSPDVPFKRYIRKWTNWIIDYHWIFTLKFLIESLPTNKLYFFIKNYPILDNFILHWMWWSYTLNKDIENLTNDPFRAIGSMPWLANDIIKYVDTKINEFNNNNNQKSNNNNSNHSNKSNRIDKENNNNTNNGNNNKNKSSNNESKQQQNLLKQVLTNTKNNNLDVNNIKRKKVLRSNRFYIYFFLFYIYFSICFIFII